MKYFLTAVVILLSTVAYAQPTPYSSPTSFQQMRGNYAYKQIILRDSTWVDSAMFDVTAGTVLSLDTAGGSASGFYRIKAGAISGFINGSGANTYMPYFTGASTLGSESSFTYLAASDALSLSPTRASLTLGANRLIGGTSRLRIQSPAGSDRLIVSADSVRLVKETYLEDTVFIGEDVVDATLGSFYLGVDTAGLAATGFSRMIARSGLTGSGTSGRVAYWNGASSLTSSGSFLFDGGTTALSIAAGTSTTPLSITGATGDNLQLLSLRVDQAASESQISAASAQGIAFLTNVTYERLSLDPLATVFNSTTAQAVPVSVLSATETVFYADVANNRVGINEATPNAPLHIDANGATAIELEAALLGTVDVGVGTINNLPSGVSGDPARYVRITVNGSDYFIPLWSAP